MFDTKIWVMKQTQIPTKKAEARKSDFTPLEPVQKM